MLNAENIFKQISETGIQFIVLKNIGTCYCVNDTEDLFGAIPDPYCKKCFGTGIARKVIVTQKMRYSYTTTRDTVSTEKQAFERIIQTSASVYFPTDFELSATDLVVFLELDLNNEVVVPYKPRFFAKIKAIHPYIADNLRFQEVIVTQINYLPFDEVIKIA